MSRNADSIVARALSIRRCSGQSRTPWVFSPSGHVRIRTIGSTALTTFEDGQLGRPSGEEDAAADAATGVHDPAPPQALQHLGQVSFRDQRCGGDLVSCAGVRGRGRPGAPRHAGRIRRSGKTWKVTTILKSDLDIRLRACILPVNRISISNYRPPSAHRQPQPREDSAMNQIDERRLESDTRLPLRLPGRVHGLRPRRRGRDPRGSPGRSPRWCRRWSTPSTKSCTPTTPPGGTSCHASSATRGRCRTTFEELTPDHPMIRYRKEHLARYLAALVTKPYDGKMVAYLDMVGKIHTPKAGAREHRRAAGADERAARLRRRRVDGGDPGAGPDRVTWKRRRCGRSTSCSGCRTI